MVLPFGISIGDFIAVGKLAHEIAIALNDTRGAAAEYRALIELLQSLVAAVQKVTNFVSSSAACATLRMDQALANGIIFHVKSCRELLEQFSADSQKYTISMMNGQGSKVKNIARKLKWSLYKYEDAQKLEQRLNSHLMAFQTYLVAMDIQFSVEATDRLEANMHGISHSLSEIHTLVTITQRNKPRSLGYPWEADLASSHVQLEDFLGRRLVLPITLCRNAQTFYDTLELLFADHPGYQKVTDLEFEIVAQDDDMSADDSAMMSQKPITCPSLDAIRPGARLGMNALIKTKRAASRKALIMPIKRQEPCPGCGQPTTGAGLRKCKNCETQFRRTTRESVSPGGAKIKEWPKKTFKLEDMIPLTEMPARRVKMTSTRSDSSRNQLAGVHLGPDSEQRYFKRAHHVTVYEIRCGGFTTHHASSRLSLIQAAGQGHARWVQDLLLKYDVDPNTRSFSGRTPLQVACSASSGRPEVVAKMLIEHGADVNAASSELVHLTALQAACKVGNEKLVDILLDHDANIHAMTAQGSETALTAAIRGGNENIINRLLNMGADLTQRLSDGHNALGVAARVGNLALVDRFVQAGADAHGDSGTTALRAAVEYNHYDVAKWLLELGVEMNYTVEDGKFERNRAPIHSIKSSKMLELLLAYGADINSPANKSWGFTALQQVAKSGSMALMEELIDKGADIQAPGSEIGGLTALQGAACAGNLAKVKILVERYGADLNEPRSGKKGFTTLEAACQCNTVDAVLELIDYLLDYGARLTPFALHIAAAGGYLPVIKSLLRKGARISDPAGYEHDFFRGNFRGNRMKQFLGKNVLETAELNKQQHVVDYLKSLDQS